MARRPLWKKQAYEDALVEIIAIEDAGHKVERFTDYHWKINGIDVWPSSKKYMKNGQVKSFNKLEEITNQ